MADSPQQPEPLTRGALGKLAGRDKGMAGALVGRRDLGREGRLQWAAVEDRERAAGPGAEAAEVEAAAPAGEREAEIVAKAAAKAKKARKKQDG